MWATENGLSIQGRYTSYNARETPTAKSIYQPFDPAYEVSPSSFRKIKPLGSGRFGEVYLACLITSKSTYSVVAVKEQKLLDSAGEMSELQREQEHKLERDALRNELNILKAVSGHPNIVCIIGAVTIVKESVCVLIEYCENGSLDSFLRAKFKNGHFFMDIELTSASASELLNEKRVCFGEEYTSRRKNGLVTTSDLLWFALQVARGLNFLSKRDIVHRDIALRNVLLKKDFSVRLADFGLARKKNKDGYFLDNGAIRSPVPFRHAAPESLRTGRFSTNSDLWGFAVVLWEIFTIAQSSPYAELKENECNAEGILAFIEAGKRLEPSKYAPVEIAVTMSQLWNLDPSQRPSFESCINVIFQTLRKACPEMILADGESVSDFMRATRMEYNERRAIKDSLHRRRFRIWMALSIILALLGLASSYVMYEIATKTIERESTTDNRTLSELNLYWEWKFNHREMNITNFKKISIARNPVLSFECVNYTWISFVESNFDYNSTVPIYTFMAYYTYNSELTWRTWETIKVLSESPERNIEEANCQDDVQKLLSSQNVISRGPQIIYKNLTDEDSFAVRVAIKVNKDSIDRYCSENETETEILAITSLSTADVKLYCNASTFESDRFLFFNDTCYGSPKEDATYAEARLKCNHIPGASIARLAWITSNQLLIHLTQELVTKYDEAEQQRSQNRHWYIGAFQNASGLENVASQSARKNWYWMNADETFGQPIDENSDFWADGEPNDCSEICWGKEDMCDKNLRVAVLAYRHPNNLEMQDTLELLKHEYVCEYR